MYAGVRFCSTIDYQDVQITHDVVVSWSASTCFHNVTHAIDTKFNKPHQAAQVGKKACVAGHVRGPKRACPGDGNLRQSMLN